MTSKNLTPHEIEAIRVGEELDKTGLWECSPLVRRRVENVGILDDMELHTVLALLGLAPRQIGESLRRVHESMASADAVPEQA